MSLLGGIIGGAAKIGAGIFGGIAKARAMKRVRRSLEKEARENENDYNRDYNQDYTQSSIGQQVLTALKQQQQGLTNRAAGESAVMGATDAAAAQARAAANAQTAGVLGNLAAAGEQRKQGIKATYQKRKDAINQALREMDIARAQNISNAMGGVASATGDLASGIDDYIHARYLAKNAGTSDTYDWTNTNNNLRKGLSQGLGYGLG